MRNLDWNRESSEETGGETLIANGASGFIIAGPVTYWAGMNAALQGILLEFITDLLALLPPCDDESATKPYNHREIKTVFDKLHRI